MKHFLTSGYLIPIPLTHLAWLSFLYRPGVKVLAVNTVVVSWHVTPCSLAEMYRRFRGNCSVRLQVAVHPENIKLKRTAWAASCMYWVCRKQDIVFSIVSRRSRVRVPAQTNFLFSTKRRTPLWDFHPSLLGVLSRRYSATGMILTAPHLASSLRTSGAIPPLFHASMAWTVV